MKITYKDTHEFKKSDLRDLFLSVEWSSGHYPDKLVIAMKNFETVFTAWDGEKLVGLISAMDDGVMTAYVHYLLVDPIYQHQGVGKRLTQMTKEKYKDYLRIVVVAYNAELNFYESCGFKKGDDASPMFITSLWTQMEKRKDVKEDEWMNTLKQVGFSDSGANNLILMTEAVINGKTAPETEPIKLPNDFQGYLKSGGI